MKICFCTGNIDVRGTCKALCDYAIHLPKIHTAIIATLELDLQKCDELALNYISNRFPIFYYRDKQSLEKILENEGCEMLYVIKGGLNDGIYSDKISTLVHCVFNMSDPHGTYYVGVSQFIATKFNKSFYIPHMISLKPSTTFENLREIYNIPHSATVFGRYGGIDTFTVEWMYSAIIRAVTDNSQLYFIFMNTFKFCDHPRVIFIDGKIIEDEDKNKFLCTLDAYLEGSHIGHSFGLACGEASINNIPVITYFRENIDPRFNWSHEHINILGDKGVYFGNENELYNLLVSFDKNIYKNKDNNAYRSFTPDNVMPLFMKYVNFTIFKNFEKKFM